MFVFFLLDMISKKICILIFVGNSLDAGRFHTNYLALILEGYGYFVPSCTGEE